jgi:hypothetical protein
VTGVGPATPTSKARRPRGLGPRLGSDRPAGEQIAAHLLPQECGSGEDHSAVGEAGELQVAGSPCGGGVSQSWPGVPPQVSSCPRTPRFVDRCAIGAYPMAPMPLYSPTLPPGFIAPCLPFNAAAPPSGEAVAARGQARRAPVRREIERTRRR